MNSHYQQSKSFQPAQSDTIITPDQIYQTLIRQTPNLYPLCKFKTKGTPKPLFPDAVKYPDFFNYNLVSPGRVIKKLQGPESLFKGFYYQLIKLAFQIEVEDRDYFQVLRNVIFNPEFMLEQNPSSPSSGKNYSDLQYKKILAQFMQILMHQSIPNFELTILSYPIVDEAMVKILQNLLKFKSAVEIPLNQSVSSFEILSLLSQLFEVSVHQYGSCYKFEQSDIFFYEHSRNEYYIAFLNEMAEMSDASESSRHRDSSYEPVSSKKIVQCGQDDVQEYAGKNARRNHEYINSQFQIETPSKQQPRQSSSNLTESKRKSQGRERSQMNYRNTVGYSKIKMNEEKVEKASKIKFDHNQQSQLKLTESKNPNQSRESLINELHKLVHQTQQSNIHSNSQMVHDYGIGKKIQIPHVPLAKSIAEPTQALHEYQMGKDYKLQLHKAIKQTAKYEYQAKDYGKKLNIEESSKFIVKSAQSDQVIGYSDFTAHKSKPFVSPNLPSNNLLYKNYLAQPLEPKINIQHYTVQKPKQIQQLGLIGTGKPSDNFTFGSQQKFLNYQLKSNVHTSQSNLTRFSQQMPFLSNTKASLLTNITPKKTESSQYIFYSPKPIVAKPTFTTEQTNIYKTSFKNQQSLGTLYKQFSDTKVLDILPEQMQNNIRKMRRKYKGIHAKEFFGLNRY